MRFVSYEFEGVTRAGLVEGDGVTPLPAEFGSILDIVRAEAEGLQTLGALSRCGQAVVQLDEVHLLAPITAPRRDILATGWNYWKHFEEGVRTPGNHRDRRPAHPTFFTKSPDTVIGPYDDILYDAAVSRELDYEGEVAVVIGRKARNIDAEEAWRCIFGYMLANDVSARDLQRRHGGQWLKGKSLDRSCPLGPALVTADEIPDPHDIPFETFVNGEIRQRATTGMMAFGIPTLIAELSHGMTLHPGDILLTGTPSGVGYAREPPLWLRPGDEITIRSTLLGELRNRVQD